MKTWMNGSIGIGALAVCILGGAGCATPSGYSGHDANMLEEGGSEPAFFSDDVSMREIADSQELLSLQNEEYQVGPDDVLEVSIFEWEANEQTKTLKLRVSETGIISLPVVGALNVAGQSVQNIQKMIEDELRAQGVLQTPRVGVWVSEFRSRQISVIGAVNQPGSYAIHQNVSTLLNMLTLAGGPQDSAGAVAYLIRGNGPQDAAARIRIDLGQLLETGDPKLNPVVSAGDVIFVPKAPLVYVYGAVRQPGGFTFRKQLRALEALALAGGFGQYADRGAVSLIRRMESGEERVFTLDLAKIEKGQAPNVYLRDHDVLHVRVSAPRQALMEALIFLRGLFTVSYRLE
jgi:polysaccharide biosynthesis/export protein